MSDSILLRSLVISWCLGLVSTACTGDASPSPNPDPEALKTRADALQAAGRLDEAFEVYSEALAAASPGSEMAARLLLHRGWVDQALGRPKEAGVGFAAAAELARSLDLSALEGRALLAPLDFYAGVADPVDALLRSKFAVELANRAEDLELEAWARVSVGQSLLELGAPAAALGPLRRARQLALDGGRFPAVVDAGTLLASSLLELRETDHVREELDEVERLVAAHGLEDRRHVIERLRAAAQALDDSDRMIWATPDGEEVLPAPDPLLSGQLALLREELAPSVSPGPEDPATLAQEIAALMGDLEAGLDQMARGEKAWRAAGRGDVARARQLEEKRFQRLRHHIEGLESGGSLGDLALWRRQEASSLKLLFSYSLALDDFESAAQYHGWLEARRGWLEPVDEAALFLQQGTLNLFQGEMSAARGHLEESLVLLATAENEASGKVAPGLRSLAHSLLALAAWLKEDPDEALRRFRLARQTVKPDIPSDPCAAGVEASLDQLSLEMVSNVESNLALALSSAGHHDEALRRSLCAARLAKGVLEVSSRSTPLEALARAHLYAALTAEDEARERHLRAADALFEATSEQFRYVRRRQPRSDQLRQLDTHSIPDEAWQRTLILRGRPFEALHVAERARAPELLAGEPGASSLERARALAAAHGVTFVVYSLVHDAMPAVLPLRFAGLQRHLEESLYVWVIPPEGPPAWRAVDLWWIARRGGLAYAVEQWADEIAGHQTTLHDLLLAPIRQLLPTPAAEEGDSAPRLVIVPHGALHRVPFSALRGVRGRALIEDFEILVTPSITSFGALSERPPSRRSGALVVGDPTRGVPSRRELPGARREARRLSEALGGHRLLGVRATPEAIGRHLQEVEVFHFAGHGEDDRLILRGAGVQEAPLDVEQVMALDLDLELAVLSACRTADGRALSAGLLGISRAFLAGGTRTVLASLWPAEDLATEAFMELFYRHLASSKDPITAHRLAVLERIHHDAPAREWAGLVLRGGAGSPAEGQRTVSP